jgi:hypothetical protein
MATDGYQVQITNQVAFDAALAAAAATVADLKGPLGETAGQAITDAVAACPRLTGRLAGAHHALPAQERRVRLVCDTPYAAVIHWGWPGHGIRRQPWLVATWMRNPAPIERMGRAVQAGLDRAAAKA